MRTSGVGKRMANMLVFFGHERKVGLKYMALATGLGEPPAYQSTNLSP